MEARLKVPATTRTARTVKRLVKRFIEPVTAPAPQLGRATVIARLHTTAAPISEITKRPPGARPTRLPPAYGTILGEHAAAL